MQIKKLNCIVHRGSSSLSNRSQEKKGSPVKKIRKRRAPEPVSTDREDQAISDKSAPRKNNETTKKQEIEQLPLNRQRQSLRKKNKDSST